MIEFYKLYDGLFIGWNSKKSIRCKGRLDIPSITTLKQYLSSNKDLKIFSKYINLKWIPFDIDYILMYATFIVPHKNTYKLIRLNANEDKIELNLSIQQYVLLGAKVMGLYHWQYYLSKTTYEIIKHYSDDGFFYMLNQNLNINVEGFFNSQASNFPKSLIIKDYIVNLPESFDIINHRKNSGCTPAEIRKIELSINKKLPSDLSSFLYSKYTLELHFKFKNVESNFKMLNLGQIFGGKEYSDSSVWKNSYAKHLGLCESHEKKYGSFFPFIFEESGHTVFRIENNEISIYFIEDLEPYRVNLDFSQFIRKLSQCAGISGWQNLFTNQYSIKNPRINEVVDDIKTCFPNLDINQFMN